MALTESSSLFGLSPRNRELSDRLDADIALVRAEIDSLTKRKQLLTASLVSSTKIQSRLKPSVPSEGTVPTDPTPLQTQVQHNQTNVSRLAYGVTSFPFTDPNPDTSDRPLLGIRFDIPSRNGKFEKAPYYIFLKRLGEDEAEDTIAGEASPPTNENNDLKIHHHTIPALVPLQDYEAKYLPQPLAKSGQNRPRRNEDHFSPSPTEEQEDDVNTDGHDTTMRDTNSTAQSESAQDLHALVAAVRHDLISWQLRNDAIDLLAEQLNLSSHKGDNESDTGKFSLQSLGATAVDARFCRLVWQNGTVGRLRLTDDGYVDRAVVIGETGDEGKSDRLRDIERLLCGGKDAGKLEVGELFSRLAEVEKRLNRTTNLEVAGTGVDEMNIDT